MLWTLREVVELFHLALLGELGTRLGKDRYVIKGGCNLRFFFHSIRYSEDLDVDVGNIGKGTLQKAFSQVLTGRSLRYTLGASGIELVRVSAPKQTDTTQRWKLGLELDGNAVHTKVEFSRRGRGGSTVFERVDPALTAHYGLPAVLATHYDRQVAVSQKLGALTGRSETQARDVFDLHLLLTGAGSDSALLEHLKQVGAADRDRAVERVMSVDFEMFKSQVVAYLPADRQANYSVEVVWEQMLAAVVDTLSRS